MGLDQSASQGSDRKSLARYLGQKKLSFHHDEGVMLCFNWDISFDWTGEAESDISLNAGFPKVWNGEDERGILKKLPVLFRRLVSEKGVSQAAGIVLRLAFGDGN